MFNPTHILNAIQTRRHPPINTILKDFEGVVRPGGMLRMSIPNLAVTIAIIRQLLPMFLNQAKNSILPQ